jgi:2-keto-4-pentenoate hydratase/2-oxohepta-3-ene-1,7-dioic acid hydratase in catechol pathway
VSERVVQWWAGGQFSLGKSFPTFGPMGPWLVTPDELSNPDDLAIACRVNDEVMQASRTSDMVFGVARLVAELSAILPLLPGDVIFTGTPPASVRCESRRDSSSPATSSQLDRRHRGNPKPVRGPSVKEAPWRCID